ncbi:MAG: hypothetical protein AVDCRST_MAG93-9580, partial [uncultured Chloroflexia bacterium]
AGARAIQLRRAGATPGTARGHARPRQPVAPYGGGRGSPADARQAREGGAKVASL